MAKKAQKFLVGIDEVGRGPLAGPVAVGVLIVREGFDFTTNDLKGVRDSKKILESKRKEIFVKIKKLQQQGELDFVVNFVSEKQIDKVGIAAAIKMALERGLNEIMKGMSGKRLADYQIYLDGGLKAPVEFVNQQTVIKGDDKIKVISAASIVAKVTRDRRMRVWAKKYPQYGFDKHKGYGTAEHRRAIKTHGLCPIHRRSFCKKWIVS